MSDISIATAPNALRSRVLGTELFPWKDLKFLQGEAFKELPPAAKEKLKASILAHNFSQPFYVWEDTSSRPALAYCLDGRHRSLILHELVAEGHQVPDLLPATFIECHDRKEAAKLVLQYSSVYAKITEEGMAEFLQTFDLSLAEMEGTIDIPGFELLDFGNDEEKIAPTAAEVKASLFDRFLVPPFSVLDARQGYWQERKKKWHGLGFDSQESREDVEIIAKSGQSPAIYALRNAMREATGQDPSWDEVIAEAKKLGHHLYEGASIFDPVLCEVLYHWFAPQNAMVLDPFAGGSVRGIVAGMLGHRYHGIDLREEQVQANRRQAVTLDVTDARWYTADSRRMHEVLPEDFVSDFLFSCPPYHDLEKYSDDPDDLSNKDYDEFLCIYREIIAHGVQRLKDNRFACFVVGEIRDKKGAYRDFVGDTVQAFRDAGMMFYNEIILLTVAGSLPIRVGRQFTSGRKVGKTHQNVLVFYKGDPKNIKEEFPEIIVPEDLDDQTTQPNIALPSTL